MCPDLVDLLVKEIWSLMSKLSDGDFNDFIIVIVISALQ